MTDTTDTTTTAPAPTGTGAPIVGGEGAPPPPAPPTNPLEGMTPDQVDALAARIEEARKNRPPSLAQQLADLQASLATTAQQKDEKVEQRKSARDEADALEIQLAEIRTTLRRTELAEAAKAAGFKTPQVIADLYAAKEGDIAQIVTEAAASGAFAMSAPAPSAEVGGQASKTPPGMDPGRAALIEEIRKARGL